MRSVGKPLSSSIANKRAAPREADGEALPFFASQAQKEGDHLVETKENTQEKDTVSYQQVRCLFCHTGKERAVVRLVEQNGWGRAIFPQRVKTVRQGKQWIEESAPLVPGYVFVYSFAGQVRQDQLFRMNHVIRVLRYDDGDDPTRRDVLAGADRDFADWLWQLDGRIGRMKALKVGDRVEIVDGIFKKLGGTITQMDRRRQVIKVELGGDSVIHSVWLSYDIIEKIEEQPSPAGGLKDERESS